MCHCGQFAQFLDSDWLWAMLLIFHSYSYLTSIINLQLTLASGLEQIHTERATHKTPYFTNTLWEVVVTTTKEIFTDPALFSKAMWDIAPYFRQYWLFLAFSLLPVPYPSENLLTLLISIPIFNLYLAKFSSLTRCWTSRSENLHGNVFVTYHHLMATSL